VLRVSVGQGVKFINATGVNQRIVGGSPAEPDADALDSGLLEPNAVYETSFDAPGVLSFFSSEDPDNLNGGSITVEE
jgi:plastocyanin